MNPELERPDEGLLARMKREPGVASIVVFATIGIFAYLPLLLEFLFGLLHPDIPLTVSNRDFANYWMGARLTLAGKHLDLFSQPVYFAYMQQMFGPGYPIHNWGYPPHILLLLWPFGLLPYKISMVAFLGSTLVLFLAAAIVFRRAYAPQSHRGIFVLAIVAYAMMMLDTAQNGFLTAAALLFGLAWMKDRPVLAGIAFGVLTVKPQLGFLVPVLLLIDRNWKTLAWSSLASIAFVGASVAWLGAESWHAYVTETIPYQRSVMTDWYGIFLRMMPTAFGSMRTLGFSPETAWLVQWPVTVASAVLVVWLLAREREPLRRAFILATGTLLVSPYAFNYDMGAVVVTGALLVASRSVASRPVLLAVGTSAAIASAVMNLGRAGLPLTPLILAASVIGLAVTMASAQEERVGVPGTRQPG